jgi:hypothetical protein
MLVRIGRISKRMHAFSVSGGASITVKEKNSALFPAI